MEEVLTSLSEAVGVVGGSSSPLNGLEMVGVKLDCGISILEGWLVSLELEVTLSPVTVDDGSKIVVRLGDLGQAPSVAVDCSFVL